MPDTDILDTSDRTYGVLLPASDWFHIIDLIDDAAEHREDDEQTNTVLGRLIDGLRQAGMLR